MERYKTMKERDFSERPYEKCNTYGVESLSDIELLAVVLKNGTKGQTACGLAEEILNHSEYKGLVGLCRMPKHRMLEFCGIGDVKAIQLQCIVELSKRISKSNFQDRISFENPISIANYFMEDLRHLEQEQLHILLLDTKGRLLKEKMMFQGTVNCSIVSPREIFLEAVESKAVQLVMIHNHPSGDPKPSTEDLRITKRIQEAGELIGIHLVDHIIIGDKTHVSLREKGFI